MYLTPIKSIRAKCLDCCCGSSSEVRRCAAKNCPLYPYRMGHRPKLDTDTPEIPDGKNLSLPRHFSENSPN